MDHTNTTKYLLKIIYSRICKFIIIIIIMACVWQVDDNDVRGDGKKKENIFGLPFSSHLVK